MKKAIIGSLFVAGLIGLAGCQSSKSSGNMGTVSGQKAECCSKDKAAGECKDKANGNMGAVSEKKEGCCAGKSASECTATKKVN